MAMVINTNIGSLNSQRMLNSTNNSLKTSMERLSSGLRVNSAKDDAAGLAIGNKMTSQIRGMTVAIRNANDGISMAQTAEAAMGSITETLQRMRDLAVQSSNTGAVNAADQSKLQTEFEQLQKEIGRIITNTEFNGKKILNGGLSGQVFQVGANTTSDNRISLTVNNLSAAASTGLGSILLSAVVIGGSAGTSAGATAVTAGSVGAVIDGLDRALSRIDTFRSTLGAMQNRFTTTISNLQSSIENQSAARSRIMDADFAAETAALSRNQILQQAGVAMLSQANQAPQTVLSLLR
ncbi:flagellin [Methylotuvimicrobium sp. KM2]|uniref:flagellin N-terminal helical domain-containing protein n=1 Tax=unclassified Methylotuvimicrobium TaxID=2822412 RepID=UPI001D7CA3D2|nr:flagellin FliC [Gammaproteobacteria bacterium]